MSKYTALFKVNLMTMLNTFKGSVNKSKNKKPKSGVMIIVFIGVIAIYVSSVYSFMLGGIFGPAGMIKLVPTMMSIVTCLVSLIFTVFAASGMLFGGRDMDFMLSLPLSSFSIMLSKLVALYAENLIFCIFMVIPSGISYIVNGGEGGVLFMITLILMTFFLAIIPTFLATLIGYVISWFQSRFGKMPLLSIILYLVLFCGIMVFSLTLSSSMNSLIPIGGAVESTLNGWLYPFGVFQKAIYGDFLSMLWFAVITTLPFVLIIYLFSRKYKEILSRMASKKVRSDYKLGTMSTNGQLQALLKKEIGRFFGTPTYFFNTGIGAVMAVIACVAAIIYKDTVASFLNLFDSQLGIPIIVIASLVLGFFASVSCPACVTLSLEGKTLWILKEAPIRYSTLLLAKVSVNVILIWGTGILCIPMLWYALALSPFEVLALFLLMGGLGVLLSVIELFVNIMFPKMDSPNDMLVVKNSTSAIVGAFGGMGVVAVAAGLYYLLSLAVSPILAVSLVGLISLFIGILLWKPIVKAGTKMIMSN